MFLKLINDAVRLTLFVAVASRSDTFASLAIFFPFSPVIIAVQNWMQLLFVIYFKAVSVIIDEENFSKW